MLLRSVGTTPGQLRFLRTLSRCDSPQRLGEIAERLDVAPRSVTSKVDQAEADGHVRRIPDPTDRRATLIELTDGGARCSRRWPCSSTRGAPRNG